MNILAIETSCDETACAVIKDGTKILSNVVATSSDMHERWGGIVPEVAARKQLEYIIPVLIEALSPFVQNITSDTSINVIPSASERSPDQQIKAGDFSPFEDGIRNDLFAYKPIIDQNIDAVAVTVGPGLIGSLLIGIETAKTIAWICHKPVIPVNHVLAHMYANFVINDEINPKSKIPNPKKNLGDNIQIQHNRHQQNKSVIANNNSTIQQFNNEKILFPAVSLVVSGGHTELYLMESPEKLKWLGGTLDDAAGEAFDKTARLLGFGAGGGLAIQNDAKKFKVQSSKFKVILPRPMINDDTLNFSFSGLKTAVVREWNKSTSNQKPKTNNQELINAFSYEIQEAITDVLVIKTLKAAVMYHAKSILISGGVASNIRLRKKFNLRLSTENLRLFAPPVQLCTDNAVYIGSYAYFRGVPQSWQNLNASPNLNIEVKE